MFVDAVFTDDEHAVRQLIFEEVGLDERSIGSPLAAALGSFAAFSAGAFVPLLPYLIAQGPAAFTASLVLSLVALAVLGVGISRLTRRPALFSAAPSGRPRWHRCGRDLRGRQLHRGPGGLTPGRILRRWRTTSTSRASGAPTAGMPRRCSVPARRPAPIRPTITSSCCSGHRTSTSTRRCIFGDADGATADAIVAAVQARTCPVCLACRRPCATMSRTSFARWLRRHGVREAMFHADAAASHRPERVPGPPGPTLTDDRAGIQQVLLGAHDYRPELVAEMWGPALLDRRGCRWMGRLGRRGAGELRVRDARRSLARRLRHDDPASASPARGGTRGPRDPPSPRPGPGTASMPTTSRSGPVRLDARCTNRWASPSPTTSMSGRTVPRRRTSPRSAPADGSAPDRARQRAWVGREVAQPLAEEKHLSIQQGDECLEALLGRLGLEQPLPPRQFDLDDAREQVGQDGRVVGDREFGGDIVVVIVVLVSGPSSIASDASVSSSGASSSTWMSRTSVVSPSRARMSSRYRTNRRIAAADSRSARGSSPTSSSSGVTSATR